MPVILFPESTLAVMRVLSEDNLPHVAQIQDMTSVRGPGAITTQTPVTVATVDCRLSPITAAERVVGDQALADATWYVVLPAGTAVTEKQRIIVTGETLGDEWTETLLVVGVPAPRAYEVMRKVLCKDA